MTVSLDTFRAEKFVKSQFDSLFDNLKVTLSSEILSTVTSTVCLFVNSYLSVIVFSTISLADNSSTVTQTVDILVKFVNCHFHSYIVMTLSII